MAAVSRSVIIALMMVCLLVAIVEGKSEREKERENHFANDDFDFRNSIAVWKFGSREGRTCLFTR